MINNIQALRAIAALLVVYSHVAAELGLRCRGGAGGVDIFFVISGFIIAYIASGDRRQFLTRRLIRVLPVYWISTLTMFALVLAMPARFHNTSADLGLLIRSLLFVPDASSMQVDGFLYPTLIAGWTLNYEMYFYVVFAIGLVVLPRRPTLVAIALLFVVMAIVQLTPLAGQPVARFYGYPIVIEFILGMLGFHVVGYTARYPMLVGKHALLGCGIIGMVLLLLAEQRFGKAHRWFVCGVPAFAVVGSAVMLERLHGFGIRGGIVTLLGDASYALYLTHAYVVNGTKRLMLGDQQLSQPVGYVIGLALMAGSIMVAIVIHRYAERPLLNYLKRRFVDDKRSSPKVKIDLPSR